MVTFTVWTGAWPNNQLCAADRVPVKGEIFTINGEDWTVGPVRWQSEVQNSTALFMHAHISLYKEAEYGQGPIIEKPSLGKTVEEIISEHQNGDRA